MGDPPFVPQSLALPGALLARLTLARSTLARSMLLVSDTSVEAALIHRRIVEPSAAMWRLRGSLMQRAQSHRCDCARGVGQGR